MEREGKNYGPEMGREKEGEVGETYKDNSMRGIYMFSYRDNNDPNLLSGYS